MRTESSTVHGIEFFADVRTKFNGIQDVADAPLLANSAAMDFDVESFLS